MVGIVRRLVSPVVLLTTGCGSRAGKEWPSISSVTPLVSSGDNGFRPFVPLRVPPNFGERDGERSVGDGAGGGGVMARAVGLAGLSREEGPLPNRSPPVLVVMTL